MRWWLASCLVLGMGCSSSGDLLNCDDEDDCETGEQLVQYQARGVGINQIALYQSVKVPFVENGAEVSSGVPVVGGKEAMMRVYLSRVSGFSSREITGRLTVNSGSDAPMIYETTMMVDTGWSEGDLSSTMNFTIDAEYMTPGASFQVELLEAEVGFEGSEEASNAVYPSEGSASLRAESTGGSLKLYILPIAYNADGSGRTPNVDEPRINKFISDTEALYPASTVDITVLPTKNWNQAVEAYGNGWGELLQEMYRERQRKSIPWDAYIYGLFVPDTSLANYCSRGCILGLSALAQSPNDDWARISIGLGFPGDSSINTFLHEIGHAHGRAHAPCQTQDYDYNYPYSGGLIGSWGYNRNRDILMPPSSYADFMGYCDPSWISDYTYGALFDRIQAVNGAADVHWPEEIPRSWQTIFVNGDGTTSLGPVVEPGRVPVGQERSVRLLDVRGDVMDEVQGHFAPFDHLPGGIMLVPELPDGVNGIQFD